MDVFSGKGCEGRRGTVFGNSKYSMRTNGTPPVRSISFPFIPLPFLSLKKTQLEKQTSSIVVLSTSAYDVAHERRSANYKPNIWSYDFVQSLRSPFIDVAHKTWAKKLKEEFMHSLSEEPELSMLHIIDSISKLGLSSLFTKFIKDALDCISSNTNKMSASKEDIRKTALSFRLLRQYGYNVSQDVFDDFIYDEMVPVEGKVDLDLIRGSIDLFEASHLAMEGEEILLKAKALSYQNLIDNRKYLDDDNLAQQVNHALNGPGVVWFDVVHQIHAYEQENTDKNKILIKLAKLNFNITQAMLIEELKELSRWWNNLGLIESIDFSRDRLVESFLWTVGITFEPQYALVRKCLTKIATLILVIDDLYDIYGSFDELMRFTNTVERWDSQEIMQQLPKCMKICFETLRTTTAQIANEIEKETGCDDISFYLIQAWGDFCKALLSEARWYDTNNIPSLEEYIRSAWITSSGPLAAMVTLLCTANNVGSDLLNDELREYQHLVYYISLIIRLSNDLGTSAVELERGDSPSSVLCYMVEANVTEEMARVHVKNMISDTWKKINKELLSTSPRQQKSVNLIINMARVSEFIYRDGDCFSGPNKDTRKLIKWLLIAPIELSTAFD
ncbi:alpha-farnesene synthase-like [Silene latifolia]|uniref:alpha-farnesene synthase-like n=1 Tax=Silene latifolia TaxID=37657 RepID=UPI003D77E219